MTNFEIILLLVAMSFGASLILKVIHIFKECGLISGLLAVTVALGLVAKCTM